MEISIVIPVYSRQKEAECAVRSALAGGGPWRELLVVDDGSPVPFRLPADLVADSRIRIIRHAENMGESGARNTGIAEAKCDWIAFLDSDDVWLPEKLAHQARFAEEDQSRNPDTLTFYSHGFVQMNTTLGRKRALIPIGSSDPRDFASECWFMQGSTVLFHKDAARLAGPCDESLMRLQDLDWFLRMSLAGGNLRVAPFVGSIIEVGARPKPEIIEQSCRRIEAKWLTASSRLTAAQARRLSAYLDVERAVSHRYIGNMVPAAYYLARSLAKVPRVRVHLKSWWRETQFAGA